MNIPQIMGLRLASPIQERKQRQNINSNFGLTMASPLSKDTVSFRATNKIANWSRGLSTRDAKKVREKAAPMQKKVKEFMISTFGDMIATELNPKNIIYYMKDRLKEVDSIQAKSGSRDYNTIEEALMFMTDLNGAKIVMRDGGKKSVQKILQRIIDRIEEGAVELLEIENKRPMITEKFKRKKKEQYDYASVEFLEKMKHIQEEKWAKQSLKEPRKVKLDYNDLTDANYSALHLLLRLPGQKRAFELTIMGKDVSAYKDLDDKLFKILDGKNLPDEYKPLVDIVKPLNEPGNKAFKERFNKYRGDAFIFQREKDPSTFYAQNTVEYFLPLKYDLPPQYDLNNLYKIMLKCEGRV